MNEEPFFVKINGEPHSIQELLITIPERYKPMFENHDFQSMRELGRAVMFASCAQEARYNSRPDIVRINEQSLKAIINPKEENE